MRPKEIKKIARKELQFSETEWNILKNIVENEMMTRFNTQLLMDRWCDYDKGHSFGTTIKFKDEFPKISFEKLRYNPNKKRIEKLVSDTLLKEGWLVTLDFGFERVVFRDEMQECGFHFHFKTDNPSWLTILKRLFK